MIACSGHVFQKPASGKNLRWGILCTGHVRTFRAVLLPFIIIVTVILDAVVSMRMYFVSGAAVIHGCVNMTVIFGRTQSRSDVAGIGCAHAFKTAYQSSMTARTVTTKSNFVLHQCTERNVRNMVAVLEYCFHHAPHAHETQRLQRGTSSLTLLIRKISKIGRFSHAFIFFFILSIFSFPGGSERSVDCNYAFSPVDHDFTVAYVDSEEQYNITYAF